MANKNDNATEKPTRRDLLRAGVRGAALLSLGAGLGLGVGALGKRSSGDGRVWQINPDKCIQCENCASFCVLTPSAVKCVHATGICGYCELCFGYFDAAGVQTTGAEGQLCPTGAIHRRHVSGPDYEYAIDEDDCIGCGRCVEGCNRDGNGSFYLQVRHDRCVNCSQCAIAEACPSGAFVRLPATRPYLLRAPEAS